MSTGTRELHAEEPLLTELRQKSRVLMREQAVATDEKKHDATLALCDFYVYLRQDERYSSSKSLQQDAAKVRRRLITTATRMKAELERKGVQRPSNLTRRVNEAIKATYQRTSDNDEQTHALTAVVANQANSAGSVDSNNNSGASTTTTEDDQHEDNSDSSDSSESNPDDLIGSGAQPASPVNLGGAAAAPFATGWQLIELIQTVVAPDFWESQGGPGTMRYFAARRVLVVRATTDVHEQIKDLLIKLPR